MKRFVLDASAVIAFFADRPGAVRVEDLLRQVAEGQHQLYLSVVDWGEVYASIWRARGQPAADQKLAELSQLPIEVVDVDMQPPSLPRASRPNTTSPTLPASPPPWPSAAKPSS